MEDRILFRGIDDPSVVDNRHEDVWVDSIKVGRFNLSSGERCLTEVHDALSRLLPAVQTARTSILIRSLRTEYSGTIDYHLARDGNWMIAEELCTREPLDEEYWEMFRTVPGEVFLGISGPGYLDFHDLLTQARTRVMQRWKEVDEDIEAKSRAGIRVFVSPSLNEGGRTEPQTQNEKLP